jgi:hypothetical protein
LQVIFSLQCKAIRFKEKSELSIPAEKFFKNNKLPRDFTIAMHLLPEFKNTSGFLFAIVNPTQTVLSFGVSISVVDSETVANISLYYRDYRYLDSNVDNEPIAVFQVPK